VDLYALEAAGAIFEVFEETVTLLEVAMSQEDFEFVME
jgi:hypothetical protein